MGSVPDSGLSRYGAPIDGGGRMLRNRRRQGLGAVIMGASLLVGCLRPGSGTGADPTATASSGGTSEESAGTSSASGESSTGTTGDPVVCAEDEILVCRVDESGECGADARCVDASYGCDPVTCDDVDEWIELDHCEALCGFLWDCEPQGDPSVLRCVYGPEGESCSPWEQNCPEEYKCTIWSGGQGIGYNATTCALRPAQPKQQGEPCSSVGGAGSGDDDCGRGLLCWIDDVQGEMGTCTPFCTGDWGAPICPDGLQCAGFLSLGIGVCLKGCDPLAQDCPGDDLCLPQGEDYGWGCMLDASGEAGAYGDPCDAPNTCDRGLLCLGPELFLECGAEGCCSPFCDLDSPNTCPGASQTCVAWYDEGDAVKGYENVGFCAVPP